MKIGIIGGLGPLATVKFMELLNSKINNKKEIELVVINDPTTPDRTEYILDNSKPNPISSILNIVKKLEIFKCDLIVMPCNTASYFYKEISQNTDIPFINIVEETVKYLKDNHIKTVGLLATEGTIKSKIYKTLLDENNINLIIPNNEEQKIISSIIYDGIKAGKEIDINRFNHILNNLKNKGCEKIILGCTELSALRMVYQLKNDILVDAMEVLANSTLSFKERGE